MLAQLVGARITSYQIYTTKLNAGRICGFWPLPDRAAGRFTFLLKKTNFLRKIYETIWSHWGLESGVGPVGTAGKRLRTLQATRWPFIFSSAFLQAVLLGTFSLQKWRLYRKRLLRRQRPLRSLRLLQFFREPLSHHPRATRAKRFGPARFLSGDGDGRRFS